MEADEFKKLQQAVLDWLEIFNGRMSSFIRFSFESAPPDEDEVLFVDLTEQEAEVKKKAEVGLDDDFDSEVGMEVDPSNYASYVLLEPRWYKVIKSVYDALVIEVEDKVWVMIPREMVYEQR